MVRFLGLIKTILVKVLVSWLLMLATFFLMMFLFSAIHETKTLIKHLIEKQKAPEIPNAPKIKSKRYVITA